MELAFNGHAHTYQRIVPSQAGEITNYVTGGGGGVLEPVAEAPPARPYPRIFSIDKDIYALGWNPTQNKGSACSTNDTAKIPTAAADVYNFLKVTVTGTR